MKDLHVYMGERACGGGGTLGNNKVAKTGQGPLLQKILDLCVTAGAGPNHMRMPASRSFRSKPTESQLAIHYIQEYVELQNRD